MELLAFVENILDERLGTQFPSAAMDFLNSLTTQDGPIISIKMRLDKLEHDLAQAMPEISGATAKVQQQQLEMEIKHRASVEEISKREEEVSKKLRIAFDMVEKQIAEATGRIKVVQEELAESGNKQRSEIAEAKLAVGEFVRQSMAGMSGGSNAGGDARHKALNDPKGSVVEMLTDNMSKGELHPVEGELGAPPRDVLRFRQRH